MKLKLTKKREFRILSSVGVVSPADVQILRAGIAKLLKESRNPLILDLAQAQIQPAARAGLFELEELSIGLNSDLLVVSEDAELGQMKHLREATELLVSGKSLAGHREQTRTQLWMRLEKRKSELAKQSADLEERIIQQQRLPEENKHLRGVVEAMERRAWELKEEIKNSKPAGKDEQIAALETRLLDALRGGKFKISEWLKSGAPE